MDFISIFYAVGQATEAVAESAQTSANPGVVGLLGIDWKLFLAQLINFSIIVFVLWKWVFTPATRALENRTRKIETSLAEAEKIKKQFQNLEGYKAKEEQKARAEYQSVIARAEILANEQKQAILNEARGQAEKMMAETHKKIASEKENMMVELRAEVAGLVVTVAEKILAEKIDKKKDEELIKESLKSIA